MNVEDHASGGASGEGDLQSAPGAVVQGPTDVGQLAGSSDVGRGVEPICAPEGASTAVNDEAPVVFAALSTAQVVPLEVNERGWASAVDGDRSVGRAPTEA